MKCGDKVCEKFFTLYLYPFFVFLNNEQYEFRRNATELIIFGGKARKFAVLFGVASAYAHSAYYNAVFIYRLAAR